MLIHFRKLCELSCEKRRAIWAEWRFGMCLLANLLIVKRMATGLEVLWQLVDSELDLK